MTKTKKIALAMFSALLAVCVAFSALIGFGAFDDKADAESVQITMVDGAALRLSDEPALGFYATLDSNNAAFTYGMLIVDSEEVKNNKISNNYHANFASNEIAYDDVECVPYLDGGVYKIRAAKEGITESLYYTRYMGIAYAVDGNGAYTYASVSTGANARSVIDLAVANYGLNAGDYSEESQANLYNFYSNVLGKTEFVNYVGGDYKASDWDSTLESTIVNYGVVTINANEADYFSAVTTKEFDSITSFQYDLRIDSLQNGSGWIGLASNATNYSAPLLIYPTSILGNGAKLSSGISYSDITGKWLTLKITIVDATTFTIQYAIDGGELSSAVTATGYDTSKISSGSLSFGQSGLHVYSIRNFAVTTANGTCHIPMTEDAIVKSRPTAVLEYANVGMYTFNPYNTVAYTAATELTAPRMSLSINRTGTLTASSTPSISMEITYTASGNAGFGFGFSTTQFLSISHANGTNVIKYNNNGYSRVATLSATTNTIKITLNSSRVFKVSVNGGAETIVGTLSSDTIVPTYVDLTCGGKIEISSLNCTGLNKAYLNDNVETYEEKITIKTGEEYTITPDVTGEGVATDATYFSDNKNVFTVNKNGVITAENPGEAYLRVRIGTEEKKVMIVVQDEVVEKLVSETFKAIRISSSKFEVEGSNIESNTARSAMIKMSGGFDFTNEQNGCLTSANVYNGISELEFDIYIPTYAGWWGVNFLNLTVAGSNMSGYRTPVTISTTGVSANGTTLTKVNDVSFNLAKEFANFRFVIASASTATLYINGVEAYTISAHTGDNKNFQTAKILISSSSASNEIYIDNVKVTHTGEYVYEGTDVSGNVNGYVLYSHTNNAPETDVEDFSRGYTHFVIQGKSASLSIENGIYVGEVDAFAGNKYYSFGAGAIPSGSDYSTTYMQALSTHNMNEFSFDVKVSDTSNNYQGFWLTLGSSIYNRLIEMGSKGFYLFPSFYASYDVMDGVQTVTSGNTEFILNDNTKWNTYKFVKTGAYTIDIYAGAQGGELPKIVTVTLDSSKLKYFDMSLAQDASAKLMFTRQAHTSSTFSVALDNLAITTSSGTVTETFDNVSVNGTTQTFGLVQVVGVKDSFAAQYCQVTAPALYDSFAALSNFSVNKTYSYKGVASSLVLEINTKLTIKDGKQIAILLGNDADAKVASAIVISNGLAKVVSVGEFEVGEQSTVAVDVSDLRFKVYADGSVTVYDGSSFVALGTLASLDGKISFVDYNGIGSAVLGGLTINGSKKYIVEEDEDYADKQIVISAYSVLPENESINWLDWTDDELRNYLTYLRDAGFTTGMALQDGNFSAGSNAEKAQILDRYMLSVLDMCAELGLDYYVKDWILMNLLTHSTADITTSMQELLTNVEYIYHEAYRGTVGTDEPGIVFMDRLAEMFAAYKQYAPDGDFNMNFLPDYAQSWQYEDNRIENEDSNADYTHEEYLQAYIDAVGKDAGFVSIDYYPFHKTGLITKTLKLRTTYLTCLERVANLCKANNLENRQYIQINDAGASWSCTTQGEVSLQVYTHLAFGAKHLTYYTYAGDCFTDGTPNNVYGFVQTANSYVKAFEKVLLDYDWKGVYFTGASNSSYDSGVNAPVNQLALNQTCISAASSTTDTLYGVFEKDNGSQAIMAVNISLPTKGYTDNVSMTFRNATKAIVYYQGVKNVVTLSGSYSFTLAAGEGMFIIPLA